MLEQNQLLPGAQALHWNEILWDKQNGNVGLRRKKNDTDVPNIKQRWDSHPFLNE